MLLIVRRRLMRMLPLLVATLVVGVGVYFVGITAINDMQSSHAEYGAQSFGKYLVQEVPDLRGIVDGQITSGPAIAALTTIKPIGSVFKYRLYDAKGDLKVDSSLYATTHLVNPRDSFQDATAAQVASSGQSSFALRRGNGKFLPLIYSEILVPLVSNGKTMGVLSVLSDETAAYPALFSQFRMVMLQVFLLVLLAFGVPLALYLRKLTQLERTKRRLRHSAHHDELTNALNRFGFARALDEQLQVCAQRGEAVGVHILDLDRFKDVNDGSGHEAGDQVLRLVAERIRKLLGIHEQLARLGADEFAIVQPLRIEAPDSVRGLANDIVRALEQPFVIGSDTIQIGASVGYAIHPADGGDVTELMRAADVAMHNAKTHGRGRAVAFNPAMEAERQARFRIDTRLRSALANDEFSLHFQPVFDSASNKLRGFEALLRLNDERGRPISPAEFIPVAEEVGLIDDIGIWVLRRACHVAREWPSELFVAVNLSPAQFADGNMPRKVAAVLAETGLDPRRLELEVTESLLITDSENVLAQLEAIKALGPSLALDDFGTGYSSLSYLWRFPFDKLKVDRSFMADLAVTGGKSREILATILALGRVLNLKVTAEGVETRAQAAILRELHCDMVQGFLLGRPQPDIDVAATILKGFGSAELVEGKLSEPRRKQAGES